MLAVVKDTGTAMYLGHTYNTCMHTYIHAYIHAYIHTYVVLKTCTAIDLGVVLSRNLYVYPPIDLYS